MEECYSQTIKNKGVVCSPKLKNAFLGMEGGELTFFKFHALFLSDYNNVPTARSSHLFFFRHSMLKKLSLSFSR